MANKRGTIERLIHSAALEAVWYVFWTYIFPPLSGVMVAAFGISEHLPLMWVSATGIFAFAMMSLGLLAFTQWRYTRSAEHKVLFARATINRAPGNQMNLGFVMKNNANFPMEVSLTKLTTIAAHRNPANPGPMPRTITVDPFGEFFFTGGSIDISGVTDTIIESALEYELEYGRPGSRKYVVTNDLVLSVPRDKKQPFTTSKKLKPNEQAGS